MQIYSMRNTLRGYRLVWLTVVLGAGARIRLSERTLEPSGIPDLLGPQVRFLPISRPHRPQRFVA